MSQIVRTPGQFGEALRRYRLSRGWSQTQLAQQVGLRQATISRIENGHDATRIDTLCAVLAVLDLELTVAPRTQGSVEDIEDLF